MKFAIQQLEYQLIYFTELLRKSKLLPKPNAAWKRGTKEYEQKVRDLTRAINLLRLADADFDERERVSKIYQTLSDRASP